MNLSKLILALVLAIPLAGCTVAKDFTASTKASYVSADKAVNYESSKNQENFKADLEFDPAGNVTKLHVETSASTPESAIAATAAANAKIAEALLKVLERVPAFVP